MNIESTLFLSTESSLERQIRKSLYRTYKNERPSNAVMSTIMGLAASYNCVDTRFGEIELILN